MLLVVFFLLIGALIVGSQPEGGTRTPENITVQMIDAKTVEVFWATSWKNVERYDVTYNPTEDRVVSQAAGNSQSIILRELRPNTQYQVTVTAVVGGKNYRSRRLVFKTASSPDDPVDLEDLKPSPTKPSKSRKSYPVTPEIINPDPTAIGSKYTPPTSTTVRGVEIGLVLLALVVWIIAIALFFHRWGKIRMLLPYQPDYKTQQSLKVPGTGTGIVSGCTGNNTTQGQQEGPGCVQHLRWSSRYFDEAPTAKKHSPTRWASRPRVSSAIFPASPSFFYTRTSAECESPRMIRHAHSHQEFTTETIPLCQVNQPQSESPENVISINVPVITTQINEKSQKKKPGDVKASEAKNSSVERITVHDDGDSFNADNDKNLVSLENNVNNMFLNVGRTRYSHGLCKNDRNKWRREKAEKSPETEPLFFIEPSEISVGEEESHRFQMPTEDEKLSQQQTVKPKRYNRSSLKKQKFRLYDDKDLEPCKNVPIFEVKIQKPNNSESGSDLSRKPKDMKTAEMKRKTLLRKVSLQDTYLNYNQDYWLDFKKYGKFNKSIDLGYFGNEEALLNKRTSEKHPTLVQKMNNYNQNQCSAIKRQSKLPSKSDNADNLPRCDSDPIIFSSNKCSCRSCESNSSEMDRPGLREAITGAMKFRRKEIAHKSVLLPSNENITLFSERNGLIETDFDMINDMLDEECLLMEKSPDSVGETPLQVFYNENEDIDRFPVDVTNENFETPIDFSNFYEITLTNSNTESDGENVKRSKVFNFQGGQAFFGENLHSTSDDSDVFFNETDPVKISEGRKQEVSVQICSSSSPPNPN